MRFKKKLAVRFKRIYHKRKPSFRKQFNYYYHEKGWDYQSAKIQANIDSGGYD